MRRIMLVGQTGSGKRELIAALSGGALAPRRALAAEYLGPFLHTPGEFLENRRFYPALITSSLDCHTLLFLHNAEHRTSLFPPGFAAMFNRRAIGVITRIGSPEADAALAERFLRAAGLKEIAAVDFTKRADIATLRERLYS